MPRWQELCELLLNEDMTAHDVVVALGVKPSRLRRLMRSKRLAERLATTETVANKKAGHAVVAGIAPAAQKLAELTGSQSPETARRACLDVLAAAKGVYHEERE